eukprot:TRINITY_DN20673_c0_g1_i1.p3 TRINITY_DN20673_c0_g1~~TRINITY_DN20673_c0_g1_i1.p3  ORF type:complete len:128 (+),score=15.17 TRINITY_DN20673_c0_g1_i1:94-477(+)
MEGDEAAGHSYTHSIGRRRRMRVWNVCEWDGERQRSRVPLSWLFSCPFFLFFLQPLCSLFSLCVSVHFLWSCLSLFSALLLLPIYILLHVDQFRRCSSSPSHILLYVDQFRRVYNHRHRTFNAQPAQ